MKPKLLIVDDISENIHVLSNMLKDDFKIVAATSGEKALKLAHKAPQPDVIVLDILMPDINGYDVCKELKSHSSTKHIPVVFITSLNNDEDVEKGFEVGGSEFISKPVIKSLVRNRLLNLVKTNSVYLDNQLDKELSNSKDTILVVDDAPENIELILEILKDEYNVIVADSGKKAIDILDVQKPDLVLLDILMPDIDGYKICEYMKNNEKIDDIPIIFLTVLENTKDIVTGLSLGAIDYVTKPVEPIVLKAKINTHLKLKHYQDKLKADLQEKEDVLFKQSKLATIGEMFENITHQWNQPLSVISLSSGTIKMKSELGSLDKDILFKSVDAIEESTKHLSETISDFRDFLKEDNKKQYFQINDVVDKTLKLLESKFKNKSILVNNNIENMEVFTYKNALIHILMNLLSNAHDALLETNNINKEIVLENIVSDNKLTLVIKDNGSGIDPEIIDNIFNKYISTKGHKKGTGIGLYMTKKLVEETLEGGIKCYNEIGACFEVTFPIK